jgi:DNA polymerase III epsilon subunit-like protein
MYCAIDFETTGLLLPSAAPLEKQPYIVQIACLQCDADLNVTKEWMTLVKPPIRIPAEVSKIHGISDADVKDAMPFASHFPQIMEMLFDRNWLGQNVPFDMGCLWHECRRKSQIVFPDPGRGKHHTVDLMDLIIAKWGKRRKLGDVYFDIFGTKMVGAHDALADIKATVACYKALRSELC